MTLFDVATAAYFRRFKFSVFKAVKTSAVNPKEFAAKIAASINNSKNEFIERVETAGPYVNLFLNKNKVYLLAVTQTIKLEEKYG